MPGWEALGEGDGGVTCPLAAALSGTSWGRFGRSANDEKDKDRRSESAG